MLSLLRSAEPSKRHMKISLNYAYRTRIEENLSLLNVWNIEDRELNKLAYHFLKLARDRVRLRELFFRNALGCQCLIEFLDLLPMTLPKKGPFININYLYCEGISVCREAILSGINNLFHSSFASLRSALELITYHIWWQIKFEKSDDYSDFYAWLYGKEKRPVGFSTTFSEVHDSFMFPKSASDKNKSKEIYSLLCSYAHKPILEESITSIKQTNVPDADMRMLDYWANIVNDLLGIIIDLLVAYKPQALFPKDIWRKYGFNIPIGIYFDQSNYLPFEQWLGKNKLIEYRELFLKNNDLLTLLKDYEEKESLSDDAILYSWTGEEIIEDLPSDKSESKIIQRWAMLKARQRTMSLMFSYASVPHDINWKDGEATVTSIKFE